ncbi:hypothetical protein F4810DRAFT_707581 [Camillea tinctor]|nr:hypothetical protein F4810DRAFT_707581 [Camillea tinctor]
MEPAQISRHEAIFSLLCDAAGAKSDAHKTILKDLIAPAGPLHAQWFKLEYMASESPLRVLTPEEIEFASKFKREEASSPEVHEEMARIVITVPSPNEYYNAVHDLDAYTQLVEEISSHFRLHLSRTTAALEQLPPSQEASTPMKEKINALRLRKELLEEEVHDLKGKATDQLERVENLVRIEALIMENESEFYSKYYDFAKVHRLVKVNTTSYDHILSKLQALGWELNYGDSDRANMVYYARNGASQIILNIAHQCHTQLNVVFQEAAASYAVNAPNVAEYGRVVDQERQAIASEIQSLWDEVVPVAHMAVEKQYLKPILDSVDMANETREVRNAAISAYASAVLRYMNKRLMALAERIQTLVYHHQALFNAFQYVQARVHKTDPKNRPRTKSHAVKIVSPDGVGNSTIVDLIRHYMHVYGSIPIEVDYDPLESPIKTLSKIDEYVQNRAEKGLQIAQDMHKFFEIAVKAGLVDTELGGQIVLDCMLTDSATGLYDESVFTDHQLEESVAATRQQVQHIRSLFNELHLNEASTAPDFALDAYRKVAECLAAKSGHGCFKPGSASAITCPKCVRCIHFQNMIRRWGESPHHQSLQIL